MTFAVRDPGHVSCEYIPEAITPSMFRLKPIFETVDTRMHRALLISEVFREICRFLAMLDQPTLPALARTCRTLHDPALDELWGELYNLRPFIHLFIQTKTGETHQFPTSQQWVTLRNYSARTRSLSMSMLDDLPDGFPCLANPPDPDSFFPNLRAVAWYPNSHLAMLPFFRLLCGPALTSLSAEFATDPTSLAMLASLSTLCPNIVDISIAAETPALHDGLTTALSIAICRWNDLEQVSCDDLTVSAMEHLAHAKNLISLTAYASERMSPFSYPNRVQESSFARLQYLHLYAGLLSTATFSLQGLRLALTDFVLDIFDAEDMFSTPSSLRELFISLAEACSHDCLTGLYLCIVNPHFPSTDSMITIRDVRPLLSFSHLRLVSLDGFSTFSFDDCDIMELASAWPHIEELSLSNYAHHPVASLPTLHSLFHLTRSCPKLRVLELVVNMTDLTPYSAGRDLRSDVLQGLCLGNSPMNSPAAIARILHALYPALKFIDLSVWNKEPLNRTAWRNRHQLSWGLVNIELAKLRGECRQVCPECLVDAVSDVELM